ncbi:MAG: family 20 glycosylhydrolase [Phaeodactylibacter sp.]|nr:family 20 glycosylhydrolase [Phaeodactylibacter sp.]
MKPLLPSAAFLLMALSAASQASIRIIPEPYRIEPRSGQPFVFDDNTAIVLSDSAALPAAKRLSSLPGAGLPIEWRSKGEEVKNAILLELDPKLESLGEDGYTFRARPQAITIQAFHPAGLFYAVETARQLLPWQEEGLAGYAIPPFDIEDHPRFAWRGLHLDVSRHFMPVEFIKKYIDYLAFHKLNTFHWHLVDGIGWRIEVKSHPELTDWGAWRVVKEGRMPWQDFEVWKPGDERPRYGGFYTREEVKEVVAYARERFITVVPEIELPGHSEVVFQCYPELLCRDSLGAPLPNIGVYCAGNPDSYRLLEDVLDEVLELFPSEYIHIGGDEVSKSNWARCTRCQRLMAERQYAGLDDIQSHFINHFDHYLRDRGRKLIGWHEILEGELSPEASIMYWGGADGTAAYLRRGHPTVLTPGSHLYFDHYQSLSPHEPKAWGGYSPLKEVYEYEPVPEELEETYRANILGIQANVWTEYIPGPQKVEYMVFPRIAALAEVAWASGEKDWPRFREKLGGLLPRYDAMGINYARSAFRPQASFELDQDTKQLIARLETELEADIFYTLDGSEPPSPSASPYTEPLRLDQSATIRAVAVKDGQPLTETETFEAVLHKARGAKVELHCTPYGRYQAKGGYTLVDANFGGDKWGNGQWLGILNENFEAVLELDTLTTIRQVGFSCIEETGAGIYFPARVEVAVSEDGRHFRTLRSWQNNRPLPIPRTPDIHTQTITLEFRPTACRYLRVKAAYQPVEGQGVFIFVDEVVVE